ncbi:hypothetical protein Ancab_000100 [Ancistrocladus abbreviatus]
MSNININLCLCNAYCLWLSLVVSLVWERQSLKLTTKKGQVILLGQGLKRGSGYGYGFGIRVESPLRPLGLEFGFILGLAIGTNLSSTGHSLLLFFRPFLLFSGLGFGQVL